MATSSRNLNYRVLDSFAFPIDPNVPMNEGDLMYLDMAANPRVAKPISAKEHCEFLLGDSKSQSPVAHHPGSLKMTTINVGPKRTVKLICREAGTVDIMTPVYFHTDAQSFGLTAPTPADLTEGLLGKLMICPREFGSSKITLVVGREYEVQLRDSYAYDMSVA